MLLYRGTKADKKIRREIFEVFLERGVVGENTNKQGAGEGFRYMPRFLSTYFVPQYLIEWLPNNYFSPPGLVVQTYRKKYFSASGLKIFFLTFSTNRIIIVVRIVSK